MSEILGSGAAERGRGGRRRGGRGGRGSRGGQESREGRDQRSRSGQGRGPRGGRGLRGGRRSRGGRSSTGGRGSTRGQSASGASLSGQGANEVQPTTDSFLVGYTEGEESSALLRRSPLETPLRPKRQRIFEFYDQSTNILVEYVDNMPPALSDEVVAPVMFESESGSAVQLPPQCEIVPPSPAAYASCGGSRASTSTSISEASVSGMVQRGLTNDEIDFFVNYGSEDDSAEDSGDDDDPLIPTFVSRANRMFFNIGDDDDDDDFPLAQTSESAPAPATPLSSSSNEPLAVDEIPPLEYRPKGLFDYDWASFSSIPVPPTDRRETFRADEVGPTAVFSSPYEAFAAIWTPEFMQEIVIQTNIYAQQMTDRRIREGKLGPRSRITQWHDTNIDELYVFFALLLATGLCIKSDVKEYWSNDDITFSPVFGRYMSYNRFLLLTTCLHFMDNRTDLRTLTKPQAKLAKIQPVIQHLNMRFQALYNLKQNIAIDESLTQWKGWLAIKQYINTKAAGVGIKTYELCESQTGYLWRFKVYSGREEETGRELTPVSGYIATLVLDLLKGLENKGHTVWMDNFYNSPALARVMKCLGFDCVGTLRTNRQGVPTQIKTLKKNDMAPGQISGCTSGDIDIVVWRDSNRVPMISTYHGAAVHTVNGITKPIVVHDYNICMGGVDKKDQMLSAYPIERKRTRVWYKKFFRRLLNASVLNAFILHRDREAPNTQPHIRNHRVFRKTLVSQLLKKHQKRRILSASNPGNSSDRRRMPILSREVLGHFPKLYGFVPNTTKKERIRRNCILCHKRQPTYCPTCNVPLCMEECIKTYHLSY